MGDWKERLGNWWKGVRLAFAIVGAALTVLAAVMFRSFRRGRAVGEAEGAAKAEIEGSAEKARVGDTRGLRGEILRRSKR